MFQKGAIRHALFARKQFISNLFVIPKKNGELRPVINLKPLNEFVRYHHFKMEGLNSLLDLLSGAEYFTTIDLKDAYFTIPIQRGNIVCCSYCARESALNYAIRIPQGGALYEREYKIRQRLLTCRIIVIL